MSLDAFVSDARRRIEEGYYHTDGEALQATRPFTSILDHPTPVIAELKRCSPSEGRLTDDPPMRILEDFMAGGAAGISVLADPDHFDGSLDNVRKAHGTGLPVLFKDFVVGAQQIACAAHHGCAAVLLIERILEPEQREELVEAAHAAGLQVLLEVHDEAEWTSAKDSSADLIGVNARDLDTLAVDVDAQRRLVTAISSERPAISLSGIHTRLDRLAAHAAGAGAVLVGTALMRPHRVLRLKALRRPLAKVCGLTNDVDLEHAIEAGADLVGFVVRAQSPRAIPASTAAELAQYCRAARCPSVMVTPAGLGDMLEAAQIVRPDFVQWHGDAAGVRARLAALGIGLLNALGPDATWSGDGDGLVLDSAKIGGSGRTHDWVAAKTATQAHPQAITLIAGGLDHTNVAEAIQTSGAWGADASSGLEADAGRKDPEKVQAYIQQAQRP